MVSIGTFRWLAESVALSGVQHLKSETGAHAAGTALCCNKYQIFQIIILNKKGSSCKKYQIFQIIRLNKNGWQECQLKKVKYFRWLILRKYGNKGVPKFFPKPLYVYQHKTERATNTKKTTENKKTLCKHCVHSHTISQCWGRYILQKVWNLI